MPRCAGRRALVIGGSSGIGRATAIEFAREGAQVVVGDINDVGGAETIHAIREDGGEAEFIPVDVRSENAVRECVGSAIVHMGGLDSLVNVAGILKVGRIEHFSSDEWNDIFDVNVRAAFLAARYAVDALRESSSGSIVNVASAAGIKADPGSTAYAASKGAVIAFSKTLAMELAPDNIRVNAMCPGFVDTPFNQPVYDLIGGTPAVRRFVKERIPLGRMGTPEEIARYIVFLSGDEVGFVTGQAIVVDGGMT